MGRTIYFTEKELKAIRETCAEWSLMMSDGGKESVKDVDNRMDNGLGSAMKKLYKGLNCERAYKNY